MKNNLKMLAGCFGLVAVDQLAKLWALSGLKEKGAIPLIPDIFELLYVENRGAAFGIMQNKQWIFLLISLAVLGILVWFLPKVPANKHFFALRLCLGFIGAGAVGNMIDRVFRGYVIDFLYFKLIDFPVFNVADIYVTAASAVLVVLVVFVYKEKDFDKIFTKK